MGGTHHIRNSFLPKTRDKYSTAMYLEGGACCIELVLVQKHPFHPQWVIFQSFWSPFDPLTNNLVYEEGGGGGLINPAVYDGL